MSGGTSLYQAVILDHNRQPRNFRPLPAAASQAVAHNPLCGDTVEIGVVVRDGEVSEISFQGESCAVATASASLLTETLQGRGVPAALSLCDQYVAALAGTADPPELPDALRPLLTVRRFPGREQCAALPVQAIRAALRRFSGAD
ncbi:SUF system NifU family Fe-S cluster assembly protein [Methylonatrum kenyense]|uniref:Fe-S cluster assembly sulfur transfer protein SufU n=1 Tax=Methylonatrum kenyense TaxID=455253 RepID=UPI0020BF3412|nr:SUF system NifU family Fe-S cluster assembly protein [Methylonatrum kenyense]MCK8514897.1 SUF system NifU family Fe-S cluster assembly protein [Methylonatrum kenyense]